MSSALNLLHQRLERLALLHKDTHYDVPTLWLHDYSVTGRTNVLRPARFYASCIEAIMSNAHQPAKTPDRSWLDNARMYCMIIRHTTAFDHNDDSVLSLTLTVDGWRECGTFLKTIALLPFLKSLGINTLYLLPFMSVSRTGQKGNPGSIYSIRNIFKLDGLLGEPILDMTTEQQFEALVEAAHRSGMRVIVEFALRTTSLDADWAPEHPEWFYWIRSNYDHPGELLKAPHFSDEEIAVIKEKIAENDLANLPVPADDYRSRFTSTPQRIWKDAQGRIQGETTDGTHCTIPGAFADYPPDDTQPLWTDVTYLKMYDHPEFNYMAYNTLRMYEQELSRAENRVEDLWEVLENVIPWYQQKFGIDGAVLDMSHALPDELRERIIRRAREDDKSFALIEENFEIGAKSAELGFDAVVGDLWSYADTKRHFDDRVEEMQLHPAPVRFLATPDTHNSPRAASRLDSMSLSAILKECINIPGGISCIISGTELGETLPINTGLGFSPEEIQEHPAETLPIFSAQSLCWDTADLRLLHSLQLRAQ